MGGFINQPITESLTKINQNIFCWLLTTMVKVEFVPWWKFTFAARLIFPGFLLNRLSNLCPFVTKKLTNRLRLNTVKPSVVIIFFIRFTISSIMAVESGTSVHPCGLSTRLSKHSQSPEVLSYWAFGSRQLTVIILLLSLTFRSLQSSVTMIFLCLQ